MKTTLPKDPAFVKAHAINGDFGHYRGTFKNPQVLIVADPHGEDDLITARALTGTRGQYLHGLMEDLGVGDKYLVFKTAPYSMYESDPTDWQRIMELTNEYRETVLAEIMNDGTPKMILTDGKFAEAEVKRILPNTTVPIVNIRRGSAGDSGLADAMAKIKQVSGFSGRSANLKMADIPRSHLSFYARTWEGTSGDRALTSDDPQYTGKAFAVVAPQWATKQVYNMPAVDKEGTKKLLTKQDNLKLRRGMEKISSYLGRVGGSIPFSGSSASEPAATQPEDSGEGSSEDVVPL
jgi:hypothetical protein